MTVNIPRWAVWGFFPAAVVLVLGLYAAQTSAQQQQAQLPFANSVEQRGEMIRELREIKDLIKEQNALLRASLKIDAHGTKSRP